MRYEIVYCTTNTKYLRFVLLPNYGVKNYLQCRVSIEVLADEKHVARPFIDESPVGGRNARLSGCP